MLTCSALVSNETSAMCVGNVQINSFEFGLASLFAVVIVLGCVYTYLVFFGKEASQ